MTDTRTRRPHRRLHITIAGLAIAVLVAGGLLVARSVGGDEPPVVKAAALVPDTALVYVGLSTDTDRNAVDRATDLAGRFDAYEGQRDALLQRLSGAEGDVTSEDVEPWLGDEAALALTDSATGTAGSLVIIAVQDEKKARAFLRRNPRKPTTEEYKDHPVESYGTVATTFVDGYLVIGQQTTVQAALAPSSDRGKSLDENPTFTAATRELPEGRVATAYASADGLRRLLVPQGSLVGGVAVLFDQPALKGVGLAVEAEDEAARITARSILDPAERKKQPSPFEAFEPTLQDAVPSDALGYLGVSGISGALQRLVGAAASGAGVGGLGPALEALRKDLEKQAGGNLERDLLAQLRGETALVVTRSGALPVLSLVTKTRDEGATRDVLRRLQQPVAKLLTPKGGDAPRWTRKEIEGEEAFTLTLPGGAGVSYAVLDGRLVISSSEDGLRQIGGADEPLSGTAAYESVLGERPDKIGSVGFLDFSQLLELGEQTGLNDSRAYLAARDDLRKIRAVGVSSSGNEEETTAEIILSIP
jgi:hypothetical protein